MPLPFILAGAAILAGGYGVKKGIDAKADFDTANKYNQLAKEVFDDAKSGLEEKRQLAQCSIETLGKTKFDIYENSLMPFVDTFSVIKNINFDDKNNFDMGTLSAPTSEELQDLKETTLAMKEVVSGGIAALGSGGLAGLAAYGGVGLLGTASTGTAIGTLGGVAATNATLAWLGGGSLAAGGFGMAGGMVVLGGIVAGPVLAVGGMMLASKAEAAKHDAYANHDKAELAAEQMNSAGVATDGIKNRFLEINAVIHSLNETFTPLLQSLQNLVAVNQNYETYSEKDQKGVFIVASLAKTLKNILEVPVIDESGSLTEQSHEVIIQGNEIITGTV